MAGKAAAVLVAAGRGARAGGPKPKQWQVLAGRRMIDWPLSAFDRHPEIGRIVVVLHPEDQPLAETLVSETPLTVVLGGETRGASVRAALEALAADPPDLVLIHDAARPILPQATIDRLLSALATGPGAAPALPVADALWRGEDEAVTGLQARDGLFRAQTPQAFAFGPILEAHRAHPGDAADDVEVARAAQIPVAIVDGASETFKVTYPADFARAEQLLRPSMTDIRTGNGYDVHRFGPGDSVVLCGVEISHDRALQGHSDADVGMHAVTDAIYGALGEGDIGQHFPPSDPRWKGAASAIFLRHAVDLAQRRGFAITHVDCTLICEEPKIGPHHAAMKAKMSELMALEPDRVSVKATTSERLGFTGRKEGIAALATATLVKA